MTTTTTTNTGSLTGSLVTLYVMRGCIKAAITPQTNKNILGLILGTLFLGHHPTEAFLQENLSETISPQGADIFGSAEEQPKEGNPDWVETLGQVVRERGLPLYRGIVIELTNGTPEHTAIEAYKRENLILGMEVDEWDTVTQYRADLVLWAEILDAMMQEAILWGEQADEDACDLLLAEFERKVGTHNLYGYLAKQQHEAIKLSRSIALCANNIDEEE